MVVGKGSSENDLKKIFSQHRLENRLILTGELSGNALADAYKAFDLFAFSSKTETQGMVLAEAMSAGLPVIALDAPGVREIVQDNLNGRLLPNATGPSDFGNAIYESFSNPFILNQWKSQAIQTAHHFSRQICTEKLIHLYQEIIENCKFEESNEFEDLKPWNSFLRTLKAELDLISEKASAAVHIIKTDISASQKD